MRFLIILFLFVGMCRVADGQRIRFQPVPPAVSNSAGSGVPVDPTFVSPGVVNPGIPNPGIPNPGFPNTGIPAANGTLSPSGASPQGAALASPNFDPFALQNPLSPTVQPYAVQPYAVQPYAVPPATGTSAPYLGPPNYQTAPNLQTGPGSAPAPYYGNYPPTTPGYPNPAYQGQPQGVLGANYFNNPYNQQNDWLNRFEKGQYMRVIQEVHYRHTWLEGSQANEIDINDAELGFTLNWPNFLGSGEPLQISPTFIFHFWDGPQPPSTGDLPSRAYSAFLAAAWSTPVNRNFGGEIVTSLGVYTDFNTFTSRSLRVKGTGLGWIRLTPKMQLKFGVTYLNRLDLKLLPAGGLFWQPTDQLELELYFPSPKVKYQLPQMGNTEAFAYLTAGYGGDTWTIRRAAGFSDQVDLVDYRVLAGIEFVGLRGVRGFFEAGYAFNRDMLYRLTPDQNIGISDSVILRTGFLF